MTVPRRTTANGTACPLPPFSPDPGGELKASPEGGAAGGGAGRRSYRRRGGSARAARYRMAGVVANGVGRWRRSVAAGRMGVETGDVTGGAASVPWASDALPFGLAFSSPFGSRLNGGTGAGAAIT